MKSSSNRLLELDALRGIAALLVLGFHYTTRYTQVFQRPTLFDFPVGQYGVCLFFVISGFVIYMTLEKTKKPMDFIVSRFSRLFPSYWAAVVLTFLAVYFFPLPGREVSLQAALLNLTMVQQWFNVQHVDGVYWTLTMELAFYAIMFFILLIKKLDRVEVWGPLWLVFMSMYDLKIIYLPNLITTTALLDYGHLFYAGILFYNLKSKGNTWHRHAGIALCLVLQYQMSEDISIVPFVAGCFMLFYLFIYGRLSWIATPILVYFGTISYSFYLIHQNIGYIMINQLYDAGANAWLRFFIPVACTFAVASVLTFAVEKPAIQWIRSRYRNQKEA